MLSQREELRERPVGGAPTVPNWLLELLKSCSEVLFKDDVLGLGPIEVDGKEEEVVVKEEVTNSVAEEELLLLSLADILADVDSENGKREKEG